MKVFAHGKGRGEKATNYLVRQDYHNREHAPPVVLRGDHELTAELINSINREWKYTSGVLSWHPEDTVSPEQEEKLMDDFEKLAFAGLEADSYNILWVRHSHANHHELHFVIPRMELSTGKAFNPCPPKWQRQFDPLRDLYNIQENWARPDDPKRQRLFTPNEADIKYNRLKRWGQEINKSETDNIRDLLIDFAIQRIEKGLVQSREDIIKSYQEIGLSINRKGKDYITVHDTENNKKIRLKGGIFSETWRLTRENQQELGDRPQDPREERASELERLGKELEAIYQKRSEYNRGRYTKTTKSHDINQQGELENILPSLGLCLCDDFGLDYSKPCDDKSFEQQNNHSAERERELANSNSGTKNHFKATENTRNYIPQPNQSTNLHDGIFSSIPPELESNRGLQHGRQTSLQTGNDTNRFNNSTLTDKFDNPNAKVRTIDERNTKILGTNLHKDRKQLHPTDEHPRHGNQGVAGTKQTTANTTKQLGAILEGFGTVLQQIAECLPYIARKNQRQPERKIGFWGRLGFGTQNRDDHGKEKAKGKSMER